VGLSWAGRAAEGAIGNCSGHFFVKRKLEKFTKIILKLEKFLKNKGKALKSKKLLFFLRTDTHI
jgi:hypothetical protein